jgi:hypothetical protein
MTFLRPLIENLREALIHESATPNDSTLRPILVDPVGKDGLFVVPKSLTAESEVRYAKRRQDSVRIAQYADSKCGLPATFDKDGGYLCGGRKDGRSSACNKLVGTECLIRKNPINNMHYQSCGMWEMRNAGDPEGRYCPKGKLDDSRIGFGSTQSALGFSCQRCEYSTTMKMSDSEGRGSFCRLKGHPVESNACCEDNEPV